MLFLVVKSFLRPRFPWVSSSRKAGHGMAECSAYRVDSQFLAALDVSVNRSLFGRRCGTAAAEIDRMAPTASSSLVSATALIGGQSLDNAITCQHTSVD